MTRVSRRVYLENFVLIFRLFGLSFPTLPPLADMHTRTLAFDNRDVGSLVRHRVPSSKEALVT